MLLSMLVERGNGLASLL